MLESKQCLAYTLFLKVLSQRRVDAHLLISIVVLGFLLTSCAAIRGYFKDGKDGRVYQRVKIKSKVFALSALFRTFASAIQE